MPQISRGSSSRPTFGHEVLLLARSTSVRELVNVSRMRPTAEYGDPHPQGYGRAAQRAIYTHLPGVVISAGVTAPPPRQSAVRTDTATRFVRDRARTRGRTALPAGGHARATLRLHGHATLLVHAEWSNHEGRHSHRLPQAPGDPGSG